MKIYNVDKEISSHGESVLLLVQLSIGFVLSYVTQSIFFNVSGIRWPIFLYLHHSLQS